MKLNIYEIAPHDVGPFDDAHRSTVSKEDRDRYLAMIREQLRIADAEAEQPCTLSFAVDHGKTVYLKLWRFGKAATAVWFDLVNDEATPVAVTVQLMGFNGADDVAAVDVTLKHDPPLLLQDEANKSLAKDRPCLSIFYQDREWMRTRLVELLAGSLFLAMNSKDESSPTMEPMRASTPEEKAAMRAEVDRVMKVFGIIQTDWSTRRILKYTVRASEPIKGKPVADIMHVKFWVGVEGKGETLSIDGLIGVFEMLGQYVEQAPGMKHLKKMQTTHRLNMKHDPAWIAKCLKQITIDEPGESNSL